jgi:hypothetical protein
MTPTSALARTTLAILCLVGSAAAADKMKTGSYPEREATWKKFAIKDVTLGTPLAQLKGFVCESENDRGYGLVCVKFLDDRCKDRPTKVKQVKYGNEADGRGCVIDSDSPGQGNMYLDGKLAALSAVSVRGTPTDVPRVYTISFAFALDQLTDDSNIGKALIAKYGKPDDRNPPIQMVWHGDSSMLNAFCAHESCNLSTDDMDFMKAEKALQDAFTTAQQKKNAPAAPKL